MVFYSLLESGPNMWTLLKILELWYLDLDFKGISHDFLLQRAKYLQFELIYSQLKERKKLVKNPCILYD